MRNSFAIDHRNGFGMQGDEIAMRDLNFATTRQMQCKGSKSILQSVFDLLDNHRLTLTVSDDACKGVLKRKAEREVQSADGIGRARVEVIAVFQTNGTDDAFPAQTATD